MTYVYLYGGAIGETLFGIHLAQTLAKNVPGARLVFLSTRKNAMARELVEPLPYASFVECPKENITSWLFLLRMMFLPHSIVAHEPLSVPMPLWWKIILRAATLRAGSVEVRCAPEPTAHRVPQRARAVVYDISRGSIFDTIPRILAAWGVSAPARPPQLDISFFPPCAPARRRRYVVFHFFAGIQKRSIPVFRAREILAAAKKEFPHHALILTATAKEKERARMMAQECGARVLLDLPVSELICLLEQADVYVGVDTGVTHLAASLGIFMVVLGHRYNPSWLPSYNSKAIILWNEERCLCVKGRREECIEDTPEGRVYRCLIDIPVDAVIEAMKKLQITDVHVKN